MSVLEGNHADRAFEEVTVEGGRLERATFEGCSFTRCHLEDLVLADCRFSDCTFHDCSVVGVRLAETALTDVEVSGGRWMAVDFVDVRKLTFRVRFKGVKLDFSTFADLDLRHCRFEDCSLRETNLGGCDLRGLAFRGCDLTRARLQHVRLEGADLRDARGVILDPPTSRFRDTRVEPETALLVLRSMGLSAPDLEGMLGWDSD